MHSARELLRTVRLVEDVVRERLKLGEMRVEQRAAEAAEVAVLGVVDLNDAPRVDARADELAVNLDLVLGADDGEGHESAEFGVVGDGVLVVLLDVVREVVDGDVVVLNVLHDLHGGQEG